jgi:hypothetical protein
MLPTMRAKSKKSAEHPDPSTSGKDLGNFAGFAHSRIAAHFQAALGGYCSLSFLLECPSTLHFPKALDNRSTVKGEPPLAANRPL